MNALLAGVIAENAKGGGSAIVQSHSDTTSDGSATLSVPFDSPVAAGNVILAANGFGPISHTSLNGPTSIDGTEDGLNSFINRTAEDDSSRCVISSVVSSGGGETGVTCSTSSTARLSMQIFEILGLAGAVSEFSDSQAGSFTVFDDPAYIEVSPIVPSSNSNLLILTITYSQDVVIAVPDGWIEPEPRTGGPDCWQQTFMKTQTSPTVQAPQLVPDGNTVYAICTAVIPRA